MLCRFAQMEIRARDLFRLRPTTNVAQFAPCIAPAFDLAHAGFLSGVGLSAGTGAAEYYSEFQRRGYYADRGSGRCGDRKDFHHGSASALAGDHVFLNAHVTGCVLPDISIHSGGS